MGLNEHTACEQEALLGRNVREYKANPKTSLRRRMQLYGIESPETGCRIQILSFFLDALRKFIVNGGGVS